MGILEKKIYKPKTKEELKELITTPDIDFKQIDTSQITDMSYLFKNFNFYDNNFIQNIENWDVSNVENMEGMFYQAKNLNQNLLNWKVNKVKNMSWMFYGINILTFPFYSDNFDLDDIFMSDTAVANIFSLEKLKDLEKRIEISNFFNKLNISTWDVSNVENMSWMFARSNFNGDISKWDVSNVKDMSWMFFESIFNNDISSWNVSNVKDMQRMFANSVFNQNILDWDVSNVKNMEGMFKNSLFNQNISKWNISNVEDMGRMFQNTKNFYINEILEKWPKIINFNCKIKEIFSNSKIQKEFEDRIKKYQKLKSL